LILSRGIILRQEEFAVFQNNFDAIARFFQRRDVEMKNLSFPV
jgi:hypothetical protein